MLRQHCTENVIQVAYVEIFKWQRGFLNDLCFPRQLVFFIYNHRCPIVKGEWMPVCLFFTSISSPNTKKEPLSSRPRSRHRCPLHKPTPLVNDNDSKWRPRSSEFSWRHAGNVWTGHPSWALHVATPSSGYNTGSSNLGSPLIEKREHQARPDSRRAFREALAHAPVQNAWGCPRQTEPKCTWPKPKRPLYLQKSSFSSPDSASVQCSLWVSFCELSHDELWWVPGSEPNARPITTASPGKQDSPTVLNRALLAQWLPRRFWPSRIGSPFQNQTVWEGRQIVPTLHAPVR